MSKGGGSAPSAPDPYATANAQGQLNNNTAAFNAALNNSNTYGPLGSTTWGIQGYDPYTGAPIYGQHVTLNGAAQSALNNQQGNQAGATGLAGNVLYNAGSMLANPLNPQGINRDAANAAYQSAYGMIAPQQQQQTEALRAQLAAQGITDPGSQAYKTATDNLARQQAFQNNNLANQSVLTGIQAGQTAFGQNQAAQQQALANFGALNGQQIMMPTPQGMATSSTAAPNFAQYQQNAYQGQLAGYNANQAASNNFTNGLFSLGAAAIMGL